MRLGFIVNPLAGAGGPLALKGSDGLGLNAAAGWAAARAALALKGLHGTGAHLLTGGGAMGEDIAIAAGFAPTVVLKPQGPSTGADTTACVAACVAAGAQLIIFVGGDGTARDVLAAQELVKEGFTGNASSKPLIHTGHMLRSVTYKVEK